MKNSDKEIINEKKYASLNNRHVNKISFHVVEHQEWRANVVPMHSVYEEYIIQIFLAAKHLYRSLFPSLTDSLTHSLTSGSCASMGPSDDGSWRICFIH